MHLNIYPSFLISYIVPVLGSSWGYGVHKRKSGPVVQAFGSNSNYRTNLSFCGYLGDSWFYTETDS